MATRGFVDAEFEQRSLIDAEYSKFALIDFEFAAAAAGGTQFTQAVAGTLTSSGLLVKRTNKNALAGTVTSAGALAKQTGKNALAGAITSSGVLVKQTQKVLAAALTISGVLAALKVARLSIAGTLTTSGTLQKQTNKVLAGALTSAGALVKSTQKVLSGTLTSSGLLVKQTNKILAGSLTSSGALVAVKAALKSVAGTLTSSGALVKQTGKNLAGVLFSTDYSAYAKLLLPFFGTAGYYRLDTAGGGTTFADTGGNGATATIVGTVTLQQAGATLDGNKAALFDGSTGYATTGINPLNAATKISIGGWFNHQGLAFASGGEALISFGPNHRLVGIGGASPVLSIVLKISGTTQTVSMSNPPTSGWHHAAATWNTGDNIRLYVDGLLVASSPGTVAGSCDSSAGVGIGVSDPSGTPAMFFNGLLDEIEWSGFQWTAAQIAGFYAIGAGFGQLVKQTQKNVAGSLTSTGALVKQIRKFLAGALTTSGALAAVKAALRSLTGSLTSSGALTKQDGKALAGALTSSGAITRRTSKSLAGTLSSAGTVAKRMSRTLVGVLTSIGTLVGGAGARSRKVAVRSFIASLAFVSSAARTSYRSFVNRNTTFNSKDTE